MAYDTFKVLIVDDDPVVLKMYGQTLSRQHYEVITASTGLEALRKVYAEGPDIVLLDIMMPEMDGYQVCTQLRRAPRTADLPILMLTALSGVAARKKAFEIGADDFVTKGEPLDHLDGRIKMLIKQRILAHTRSWLADLHGSVSIDYTLRATIAAGQPLAVCFLDLRDLGRYNELAGYDAGDRILWALARILCKQVRDREQGDHIGYRGGDDFIALISQESALEFGESVAAAYEMDLAQMRVGSGEPMELPELAIGIVVVPAGQKIHPGRIMQAGEKLVRAIQAEFGGGVRVVQIGAPGANGSDLDDLCGSWHSAA
jgi:diguanylate cyclase (GGDEF)-like protein